LPFTTLIYRRDSPPAPPAHTLAIGTLSEGQVEYVNATVMVRLSGDRSALFEDQFLTTVMSKPGDSGSLVLNEKNRTLGLLFAGSNRVSVCNRIQNVLRLLDVRL